jgi:ACS family tartrate transporter-like MFS transporter
MDVAVQTTDGVDPLERETIKRVAWRLLPLLMVGYFCNYLDRVNVGMAATTMNQQLGFSNAVFGFGSGLFFFGCFLAAVPSNLILNKLGARRWISRILMAWGILSGLTAFAWNDYSFYAVRFVLGLAEAGYFPGMVLFMTWWFPSLYRSRMMAIFYAAPLISMIIGPPIGSLLLQLEGLAGLHGWQWLFILEALPAVVLCLVFWQILTDRPADAAWLRPEQRAWLAGRLAAERTQREEIRKYSLTETFYNAKVLLLTACNFGNNVTQFALVFFTPLIVKGLGVPTAMIGLVSAVPFLIAALPTIWWGAHSDRTGERTWHVAGPFLLCSAAMAACILIGPSHPVWMMVALILAVLGTWAGQPVFWSLPATLLTGAAAAGGIGMVNAVGLLGGLFGPWIFGLVKDASGSDNVALLCLGLGSIVGAIAVITVGYASRREALPRTAN